MALGQDYADWTAPQAHASAIAVTGAPPLTLYGQAAKGTQVLAALASNTVFLGPVNQPGYEITINARESGAGAAGPLQIQAVWVDTDGVSIVSNESYYIWPGVAAGTHTVIGRGPTKGASLSLALFNTSTVMQYTVGWTVAFRSHFYLRDDWRSTFYNATASGGTLPTMDTPSDALAYNSGSILAAGTATLELPLYNGAVLLYGATNSNTSDMQLTIQDSANPNAEGAGKAFFQIKSDTNGRINTQTTLPRYQCRLVLTNNNAGAQVCTFALHAID